MVAGIFYILAAMVVVAHASPHTDHANGFVLNMQLTLPELVQVKSILEYLKCIY